MGAQNGGLGLGTGTESNPKHVNYYPPSSRRPLSTAPRTSSILRARRRRPPRSCPSPPPRQQRRLGPWSDRCRRPPAGGTTRRSAADRAHCISRSVWALPTLGRDASRLIPLAAGDDAEVHPLHTFDAPGGRVAGSVADYRSQMMEEPVEPWFFSAKQRARSMP